jgi:hypothetical protein
MGRFCQCAAEPDDPAVRVGLVAIASPAHAVFVTTPIIVFMTYSSLRDQMVARGSLAEGDGTALVVMCAL